MMSRILTWCAIVWAVVVCFLSAQGIAAPQRAGLLALAQVIAPYMFVPLFVAIALWHERGHAGQVLRYLLVVCAFTFILRFPPGWVGMPRAAAPGATTVAVTSWNLELGQAEPEEVMAGLWSAQPGFIGLQELTPRHADSIGADQQLRARFPFRALYPRDGSTGLGLLSTYPLIGLPTLLLDPPMLVAEVVVGGGRLVTVVVAHLEPPVIGSNLQALPVADYDPSRRDSQTRAIRSMLKELVPAGRPVLLFGDFNVTDREPGYADLSRGLTDAQLAVGLGPGSTWRPPEVDWLPFGLLRIDMLFTSATVQPLSLVTDCTPRGSDHCILRASVALCSGGSRP